MKIENGETTRNIISLKKKRERQYSLKSTMLFKQ